MRRIHFQQTEALFSAAATRALEQAAATALPPHALMQRAGLAVARLALALAPHARCVWIACGPGNNGGDGLEAALHLQRMGKQPVVSWLGNEAKAPPDALASLARARAAGVRFSDAAPADFDLCVDALLGIGAARAPEGRMAQWVVRMNTSGRPVLAVDVPSGLHADTGAVAAPSWPGTRESGVAPALDSRVRGNDGHGANDANGANGANGGNDAVVGSGAVQATWTLSLLTLKPGLFTAQGRDHAGEVWLDALGMHESPAGAEPAWAQAAKAGPVDAHHPTAWLSGADAAALPARAHASHKGSYGDVAVIGGAPGMAGAALLAGRAALFAGAGRVYVVLLDEHALRVDSVRPELMFRSAQALDLKALTVVCGCGGGEAVHAELPRILSGAQRLVLDADALNAVARDASLQTLLQDRAARRRVTVLTPHPLEAARLAGIGSAQVQQDRLACAQALAERYRCVVVLKGSGTVIAQAGATPWVNPSGNARLATAGTGDVLAGLIGARLAGGMAARAAACHAVFVHGRTADEWRPQAPFSAGLLAERAGH